MTFSGKCHFRQDAITLWRCHLGGGENSYDIAQIRRRAGQIKVARFAKPGDPSSVLA